MTLAQSLFSVCINPIALRKAKIVYNFGLSECNRVKMNGYTFRGSSCAIIYFAFLLSGDQLSKNLLLYE